jgi:hypothetical protein
MQENKKTRIPTKQETPTTSVQRATYGYRYAYARSLECKGIGDTGQDYLVISESETRLSFALCDGVSQSFYGDLAARFLGEALVDWLLISPVDLSSSELAMAITQYLNLLKGPAGDHVIEFRLPEKLAPMLQNALDKKRAIGSESTFIAGLIDIAANVIVLVWMGDSRLRIWGHGIELTSKFENTFNKQERWSTSKGPVGRVHSFIISLNQITHFIVYSDGFEKLDQKFTFGIPSNHAIDKQIEEAGEDDISFFEFWIGKLPNLKTEIPAKPTGIAAYFHQDLLKVSWTRASNMSYYEVEFRTNTDNLIFRSTNSSHIEIPKGELPSNILSIRVRVWNGEEPGDWSDSVNPKVVQERLSVFTSVPKQQNSKPEIYIPVTPEIKLPINLPVQENFRISNRTSSHSTKSSRSRWMVGSVIITTIILLFFGMVMMTLATKINPKETPTTTNVQIEATKNLPIPLPENTSIPSKPITTAIPFLEEWKKTNEPSKYTSQVKTLISDLSPTSTRTISP